MAEIGAKRCLGCGYIVDNLPEPRCPECGRGFDPADAHTYWTIPVRGGGLLGMAALGLPLSAAPGVAVIATSEGSGWPALVAAFGFGILFVIRRRIRQALRRSPAAIQDRWAAQCAAVLALIGLVLTGLQLTLLVAVIALSRVITFG